MEQSVKIYRENYSFLPERFVRKIEYDLNYIQERKIPGLRQIYLFGSCARGEVRSTSDIDLLIVTDSKIRDRVLAADIRWTLDEKREGVRTDIVYTNTQSEKGPSAFQNAVDRDKKLILEVM